jgi:4-hydroxybenzoate polyprenyltransferase
MQLLRAFFRLIRWPNLFFIALTQFFYTQIGTRIIHNPIFNHSLYINTTQLSFFLLMLASVFIAAGGYIINDYFDLHIDAVNKPKSLVIGKIIKRRWGIFWHLFFSGIGIFCSGIVSYISHQWLILIINSITVLLLWFYSTHFKKKLLIGNIVISALTGWVILAMYLFCKSQSSIHQLPLQNQGFYLGKLYKFTAVYAGFAFIISLIREVVKDLEDMQGDEQFGCRTMPIVWGVPATKVFAGVWIVVAVLGLLVIQGYAWQLGNPLIAGLSFLLISLPLLILLKKLKEATLPNHYHKISSLLKLIMLAGILSMVFL